MKRITSILLVDDDLDDRDLFSEALAIVDNTIRMEFAVNGLDALKKLESGSIHPDVIFSDINMPLMNGIQLLETIKKTGGLNTLPFVIYTTSANQNYQSQSQLFGAQHYIVKPTSFEKICTEIRLALDKVVNISRPAIGTQNLSIQGLR